MKRSQPNPISKGLASRKRLYREEGDDWIRDKVCLPHFDVYEALGGDKEMRWLHVAPPASERHHMGGREGRLLLKKEWWLPVCRSCHSYIEEHSNWARQHGFSI